MGFDPVPWFVEGGAQHSADLARVLGYMILNGQEGVLGATDLAVRELSTPGAAVRVSPGVCGIINRATGTTKQAYIDRVISDDEVTVAATDASGPRSDLVVARIENPWLAGEPWDIPGDPAAGPYIFSRILQDVPSGTKTLADAGFANYSAIPLARIDIPVSTATITQSMITDLRAIPAPLSEVWTQITDTPSNSVLEGTTVGPTAYRTWPAEATWTVDVPSWATEVDFFAIFTPAMGIPNGPWGDMKFVFNGVSSATSGFDDNYGTTPGQGGMRTTIHVAATMSVPSAIRGTSVNLHLEGHMYGTAGLPTSDLTANTYTKVFVQARWKQVRALS